jgi:hypothetical protein
VLFVGTLLGSIGLYMYNEYPDSPVTVLIVNRLQYDEEKGVTGNNRLTSAFDDNYYTKYFLGTSDMIWGIKPEVYQEKFRLAGNSYKLFFIRYGFIGIVSLFMFYFAMACSTNSRLLFGLFLLYCASFLQRTYALWEIELFLFVGASGIYLNSKESVF